MFHVFIIMESSCLYSNSCVSLSWIAKKSILAFVIMYIDDILRWMSYLGVIQLLRCIWAGSIFLLIVLYTKGTMPNFLRIWTVKFWILKLKGELANGLEPLLSLLRDYKPTFEDECLPAGENVKSRILINI